MDNKLNKVLQRHIEKLFLSLPDVVNFQAQKKEIINTWSKIAFIYKKGAKQNFSINPILVFKSVDALRDFLRKEKELTLKFQEFENVVLLSKLLKNSTETTLTDFFKMDYEIEYSNKEIKVIFNTNSLIFKYKATGVY